MTDKPLVPYQQAFDSVDALAAFIVANPDVRTGGLLITMFRDETPDEVLDRKRARLAEENALIQRCVDERDSLERTLRRDQDRLTHLQSFIPSHTETIRRRFADIL